MFTTPRFVEGLEGRMLMSVAPGSVALNATIMADRLQVRADLLQFRSDALSCASTLMTDTSAIRHDDKTGAAAVLPLVKTLRADIAHVRAALRADRLNEAHNVLADEIVIVGDLKKRLLDRGNATAEAADKSQLLADRIKLQQDMIAGLDARIADRQAGYATIFNDAQAVLAALQSDPNASPQLTADVQKWVNDKTTCMTTLTADLQKVAADRQQLVNDLTALQSSQA